MLNFGASKPRVRGGPGPPGPPPGSAPTDHTELMNQDFGARFLLIGSKEIILIAFFVFTFKLSSDQILN